MIAMTIKMIAHLSILNVPFYQGPAKSGETRGWGEG